MFHEHYTAPIGPARLTAPLAYSLFVALVSPPFCTQLRILREKAYPPTPSPSFSQLRILREEPYPPNTCFRHVIHSSFADPSILHGFWQFGNYKTNWASALMGGKSHCRCGMAPVLHNNINSFLWKSNYLISNFLPAFAPQIWHPSL